MSSFNKVILVGNLCKDPELRHTPSGSAVCDLRIASTTKRKAGDETLFVDVTLWERQAETVCEYMSKGKSILVEGRLKLDEWPDKDTGKTRSKISIVGQNVQFLGGKGDDAQETPQPRQEENKVPIQQRQESLGSDDVPF